MLNVNIDFEIFIDFVKNQPIGGILNSNINDIENWHSFWRFLKNGCNLTILNVPEITNENKNNIEFQFLTNLSEGRSGKLKIRLTKNFKKPHKNTFDINKEFQSIFFLKEGDLSERNKYINRNQIPIGFEDGYMQLFQKISLGKNESIVIPIGKTENECFSWKNIIDHFHFVTDIIVVDNYILDDKSIIKHNFLEIIKLFYSKNKKINLTIITFEKYSDRKLNFQKEYNYLIEEFKNHGIQFKFNLILFNGKLKEHDRGIFTNFMRLKSGDSFNFINSKSEIITAGTELDFYPLTNPKLFEVTELALITLNKKITLFKQNNLNFHIQNRLLNC